MKFNGDMENINLKDLKEAYNKAVEENKDSFKYEDVEFYTQYAKYLIEFLESADKGSYDDLIKYRRGRSKH